MKQMPKSWNRWYWMFLGVVALFGVGVGIVGPQIGTTTRMPGKLVSPDCADPEDVDTPANDSPDQEVPQEMWLGYVDAETAARMRDGASTEDE